MRSTRQSSPVARRATSAFTLVELLVVIGIIAVLVGIALPMINVAYKNGVRTRMNADLLVIASGLDAYRADFADYPRTTGAAGLSAPTGSSLLAWALLAVGDHTQDGADGPGFTTRIQGQGQVYGPYITPGRLKTNEGLQSISNNTDGTNQIVDKYGHPYLYFPAFKGAVIGSPNGYVSDTGTPMYNWNDGNTAGATPTQPVFLVTDMRKILGDINQDGQIGPGETAKYTGPYILWGAGPDETYGYVINSDGTTAKTSDDVTNFNR